MMNNSIERSDDFFFRQVKFIWIITSELRFIFIVFFFFLFSLFFEQFFDSTSSTYTYLLADLNTKEAILIDPVLEQVKRDKNVINELGFKLKYASERNE